MSQTSKTRSFRATISDVAKEAGVSVATVSRVANGSSPHIAPATRQMVVETIERLHYTPNRLIRSLQSGQTNVIAYAALYQGLFRRDEFEMATLAELCRAARSTTYDVLIPAGSLREGGNAGVSALLDGRCDGVILVCPQGSRVLEAVATCGFPMVVLWSREVPEGVGCVRSDTTGGARKVMSHLLELGHRRIAHLSGPVMDWDEASCIRDAYVRVINDAGIRPDPELVLPRGGSESWDPDEASVRAALESWMAMPNPPTAVFAACDRLAIRLLEVASRLGLRVPDDLSVAGYDGSPAALHCSPPLTTVSIPVGQVADAAVEMLREIIEERGQAAPRTAAASADSERRMRTLPAELIVRGSTSRARA